MALFWHFNLLINVEEMILVVASVLLMHYQMSVSILEYSRLPKSFSSNATFNQPIRYVKDGL